MIAVILAAGLSKRFGGKKLLEKINGKPMILHVAELVTSYGFEQKILVYSDEEVLKAVSDYCMKDSVFHFLFNGRAAEGLSTSIKLAVENAEPDRKGDGIMFFVGDQPFIDERTVRKLIGAFHQGNGSIIVPSYGANRGNPVIFSIKWFEQLKNLVGDVGGRIIMREHPEEVFEVTIEDSEIGKDIDTKEEYNAIQVERNSELHE